MQNDKAVNSEYYAARLEHRTPARYISELLQGRSATPLYQCPPEVEEPPFQA